MKYRTIYFDLDGTLTDPGLGITNSVIYALTRMGRTVPPGRRCTGTSARLYGTLSAGMRP